MIAGAVTGIGVAIVAGEAIAAGEVTDIGVAIAVGVTTAQDIAITMVHGFRWQLSAPV